MADWNQYVYSYVPKSALKVILLEGLYSGEALLKRPDLLQMAAKGRGVSSKDLEKSIKENLRSSWGSLVSKGPNVLFQLIPKNADLPKNHPVKKYKLIPIKINITKLLQDYPDTKIYGMEMVPFHENVKDKEREHFLSKAELFNVLSRSAKQLWSSYEDLDKKGLYAPNVPHASIHIKNGIIPAKYLSVINFEKNSGLFSEAMMYLKAIEYWM